MLFFRSCPKCQTGTVQMESDFYGSYISCLNCGFEKSAASVRKINLDELKAETDSADAAIVAEQQTVAVGADDSLDEEDFDDDYYEDDDLVELERAAG